MKYIDFYSGEETSSVKEKFAGISSVISSITDWEFPVRLMCTLSKEEVFALPSLNGKNSAQLVDCIVTKTAGGRYFLKFTDDLGTFYIVIHYCPIAIILPDDTFIGLYKIYETTPLKILQDIRLIDNVDFTRGFDVTENTLKFGGVLVKSRRPFHYFFELQYALYTYQCAGVFNTEVRYFTDIDECFYPFWDLPLFEGKMFSINLKNVNSLRLPEYGLICPSFVPVNYARVKNLTHINNELKDLDVQIVKHALTMGEGNKDYCYLSKKLNDCTHVLWFGICSEKRKFHQQKEVIIDIINKVASTVPTLGVVFDGMTSPVSGDDDYRRNPNTFDSNVIENITEKLPDNVFCVTLLNEVSWKKIAIATHATFFMAHHMTDSLYISRFAAVPGITHQSKIGTETAAPQYRHENVSQIPSEWIEDDAQGNGRIADTSYSISQEKVVQFFLEQFKKVISE